MQPHILFSLLCTNIFLRILFPDIHNSFYSVRVRHCTHTYRRTFILIFTLLGSRRDDEIFCTVWLAHILVFNPLFCMGPIMGALCNYAISSFLLLSNKEWPYLRLMKLTDVSVHGAEKNTWTQGGWSGRRLQHLYSSQNIIMTNQGGCDRKGKKRASGYEKCISSFDWKAWRKEITRKA
jgi:hypothetical protein